MSTVLTPPLTGSIFAYKMTVDNGGAPCIDQKILSLSICKPKIRQAAKEGDWIIGFGGKSVPDLCNRLIYIAKVTTVEDNGNYYKDATYSNRPDCIYTATSSGYAYRTGSRYHSPADLTHDLGASPNFDRARNLLSEEGNFVYFGRNNAPSIAPIKDIYDNLPRDHVKNHDPITRQRLEDFIISIFHQFCSGIHGEPTHMDPTAKCSESEDEPFYILETPRSCN